MVKKKKTDYTKPSFASSIITGTKRGGKECNSATLHGRGSSMTGLDGSVLFRMGLNHYFHAKIK